MSKRRPSSRSSSSSSTPSLINVSFDFFNPNPKVDYHALTRLLSQLFSRDAERLHIPLLVELILAQPRVGTTIKTGDAEEGDEGDPYAVLSVVNVNVHLQGNGNGGVRAVVEYVLGKAAEAEARGEGVGLCEELKRLLQGQGENGGHVGLVICERLVNMPVQVVPPMYRMLVDEIDGALRDVRSPSAPSFFFPLHLERCRANRIGSVIFCLYPARTIFQRKKKLCLPIPRRPGANRNLRKCVLRRVNRNNSRRDRVMGCIRFIPRMILFLRYLDVFFYYYGRRLTLLKGILAHADVHLYDTCTDGEGERGVWVGCEGTDDVGSAC